jgi:hypothetical protein
MEEKNKANIIMFLNPLDKGKLKERKKKRKRKRR